MSFNALDSALVKLAAASTALEHHAPTLDDVETAKDAAKGAAKILEAAISWDIPVNAPVEPKAIAPASEVAAPEIPLEVDPFESAEGGEK